MKPKIFKVIIVILFSIIVWVASFIVFGEIAFVFYPPFTEDIGHHPLMQTYHLFFSVMIPLAIGVTALFYFSFKAEKIRKWILNKLKTFKNNKEA